MVVGTLMAQLQDFAPTYPLELFGTKVNAYTGVFALAANLIVSVGLTLVLRRAAPADARDETRPEDYASSPRPRLRRRAEHLCRSREPAAPPLGRAADQPRRGIDHASPRICRVFAASQRS